MIDEIYDPSLEKQCTRCKEMWPPDEEFYRPGRTQCRACDYEVKSSAPSRTFAARKIEADRRKKRSTGE